MYQTAIDSPASLQAKVRLESQFRIGIDAQNRLLETVASTVIRDRMIDPRLIRVRVRDNKLRVFLGEDQWADTHTHAIGQICDRSDPKLPRHFMRSLIAGPIWQQRLAQILINTTYRRGTYLTRRKDPAKFLGRFVGPAGNEQLRGFVSQHFARHLATLPMLRGFVYACQRMSAQPVSAYAGDLRFSLKCLLPFVFEPIPGYFYAFGVEFSNSDFADGSLKITFCSRNTRTGITAVLDTSWSRTHLGSVVKESDLLLSVESQCKEVDAVVSILIGAVEQTLSPENVNKMLYVIERAHTETLSWHQIRRELGRILREKELEDVKKILSGEARFEELPPVGQDKEGNSLPSRWWASELAGFLATKEVDQDRAHELERLAGTILKAD